MGACNRKKKEEVNKGKRMKKRKSKKEGKKNRREAKD